MRTPYYPPTFGQEQFNCVHCGVYARQTWETLRIRAGGAWGPTDFTASLCAHCTAYTYWHNERMIVPAGAPVEPPHPDLPEECQPEYEEARAVFSQSPRAAAALLRLCIQKLLPRLGESGENINSDIRALVAKGLPVAVQRALDYCRVVGNNAVHPGEIELNDSPEVAQQLFAMINFIIEDRITRPREIDELYTRLPQKAREAIERRDNDGV
jgi:hypothetical protein